MSAFVGSSTDLSVTIGKGAANPFGVLVVREMGFATAIGLRLLFLGRAPHPVEVSPPSKDDTSEPVSPLSTIMHGLELSASLSAIAVLITQTIWRLAFLLTDRGLYGVYRVAAFAELGTLALIVIRLGLAVSFYEGPRGPRFILWYGLLGISIALDIGVSVVNLYLCEWEC